MQHTGIINCENTNYTDLAAWEIVPGNEKKRQKCSKFREIQSTNRVLNGQMDLYLENKLQNQRIIFSEYRKYNSKMRRNGID